MSVSAKTDQLNMSDVVAETNKALRVVHVTTVHNATDVRIFHRQCRSLAQAGYDVTLLAPADAGAVIDGVKIEALSRPGFRPLRIITSPLRAYRRMLQLKADIYEFHDPELLPVGYALSLMGKTVIYDSHEDLPSYIAAKEWMPRLLRPLFKWVSARVENVTVKRVSGVLTADSEIAERMSLLNRQVMTLQNYPLLEEFPAGFASNGERFYSGALANFGGITNERVAREIVTALQHVPENVRLKLVSGGVTYPESLRADLEQMPGWARVDWRGVVPRKTMLRTLQEVAGVVVLYGASPNNMQVRSNRLFEAMAAGLPVVVPNFPEWQELIQRGRCGIAVDPHRPQEIADAITFIATHPEAAREMGSRGRKLFVEQYNWAVEQAHLLDFYQKIMGGRIQVPS